MVSGRNGGVLLTFRGGGVGVLARSSRTRDKGDHAVLLSFRCLEEARHFLLKNFLIGS
jgi:hypothetical protein